MTAQAQKPVTGRMVLFVLLGMFGVVILVNGVFAYFALTTHPGEITGNAYNKGRLYNATLADMARQQASGWRSELAFVPQGKRAGTVTFHLTQSDGQPAVGLDVEALIRRPANNAHDRVIKLLAIRPGVYRAALSVPLSGNWDIHLTARRDRQQLYRLEHRLWMD